MNTWLPCPVAANTPGQVFSCPQTAQTLQGEAPATYKKPGLLPAVGSQNTSALAVTAQTNRRPRGGSYQGKNERYEHTDTYSRNQEHNQKRNVNHKRGGHDVENDAQNATEITRLGG